MFSICQLNKWPLAHWNGCYNGTNFGAMGSNPARLRRGYSILLFYDGSLYNVQVSFELFFRTKLGVPISIQISTYFISKTFLLSDKNQIRLKSKLSEHIKRFLIWIFAFSFLKQQHLPNWFLRSQLFSSQRFIHLNKTFDIIHLFIHTFIYCNKHLSYALNW